MAEAGNNQQVGGVSLGLRGFKLPGPFSLEGQIQLNWKLFRIRWESYVTITQLDKQPVPYQVALFLSCLGDDALRAYDGFDFRQTADVRTVAEILQQFDTFVLGEVNETYERTKFNRRNQEAEESFEVYLTTLRSLIRTCNFCDRCQDSLLRDRIVVGIRDPETHKELCKDRNLTLAKCVDICRAADKAVQESRVLRPEQINHCEEGNNRSTSNRNVNERWASRKVVGGGQRSESEGNKGTTHIRVPSGGAAGGMVRCKFCGRMHAFLKEQCPAWMKTCNRCSGKNHFAQMCTWTDKRYEQSGGRSDNKAVHGVHEEGVSDDEYSWVNSVQDSYRDAKEVKCRLLVEGNPVIFQLDSGAAINVLPRQYVPANLTLQPAHDRYLEMWNGDTCAVQATGWLRVINPKNDEKYKLKFLIVPENRKIPLLGYRACEVMKLLVVNNANVDRVASIKESVRFKEVVADRIGCLPGKVHFRLKSGALPVIAPQRRTPMAVRDKLHVELNRLVTEGIIMPVTEPTEWVNPIVVVPKGEEVRICLDPSHLNKVLLREHYTIPTIDEILPDIAESEWFSKADVRWGFLHVELDEPSSYLTTFQTEFGRYRWLRLPPGLSVSPEIFQRKVKEATEGLQRVEVVHDDMLIHGRTEMEHDKVFEQLIERCKEKNLVLNPKKLEYKVREVAFLGHHIKAGKIKAEDVKVRAIQDFPQPTDRTGLKRFMGMVNFVARYVANLSAVSMPLNNLLQKDVPWVWSQAQEEAFQMIKHRIVKQVELALFCPNKEVTIESDASEYGLGGVLLQEGQPIAFTSRTLTSAERNYAQIEKELLAAVHTLEKFHLYTYGRPITAITDHKPLVSITCKPMDKAPKRLQSLLLRSNKYDVMYHYRPGKMLVTADALSRAPLHSERTTEGETVNWIQFLPITPEYLRAIREETSKDVELQEVQRHVLEGWPELRCEVHPRAVAYFDYRDELTTMNGVVMRGDRIVIPVVMRQEMRKKIHVGHQGVNACIRRARELLFWPGMSKSIRQHVETCPTCSSIAPCQPKEPMQGHKIPVQPWEEVATDLFEIEGRRYSVVVDSYSNFFEVDYLLDTKAETVIGKLKAQFARYGIPLTVYSDGGPQYSSHEFGKFAQEWGFKHTVSSPGNSQSNGLAESAVKRAKTLMKKARLGKEDVYLGLLAIRNTVSENMVSSPAQRLLGRATRTNLPTLPQRLQFRPPDAEQTYKDLTCKQYRSIEKNDSGLDRNLRDMRASDRVWLKPLKDHKAPWEMATVQKQLAPRRFEVRTNRGQILVRNRRFLKPNRQEEESQDGLDQAFFRSCAAPAQSVGAQRQMDANLEIPVEDRQQQSNELNAEPPMGLPRAIERAEEPSEREAIKTRAGRVSRAPKRLDL